MAPSKLRKAIGAVKDQTSISLAKVGGSTSLADLDVAIVKATRHEEYPADERHIREILTLTVYSRAFVGSCVSTISRRLNKTKNWVVALKALMLIHRLLNDGDPAYEQEIFFATRRGTRLLNLYDFRDTSHSDSWDYSAFVRTYALYLDEQLEFRMQGRRGKRSAFGHEGGDDEEEDKDVSPSAVVVKATPMREMKNETIFSRLQHMLLLLERFLACRPTGAAKTNRVVIVALYPIVRESFQLYRDITEIMGILIDRFMELSIPDSMKVHEIFCRVAKQYDELDAFYSWCKSTGIARSSEYPDVDKISNKKLDVMEEFIREKSLMGHNSIEPEEEPKQPEPEPELEPEPEPEEDMNATKALPPPEDFVEEIEKKEEVVVEEKKQDIGDLLNLGEDAPTKEQYADSMALALFDGGSSATNASPPNGSSPWEAFKETKDWETSLVQSASHLSNQRPTLPGGFDSLVLDGMYQQGTTAAAAASSGYIATGSSSSVALGSSGRPAMLALPAPESATATSSNSSGDPFSASLVVPPPSYVQMSEMEKKQRLLAEEQMMWQQYTGNGMQGHVGLAKVQQPNVHPYNMGGHTPSY